MDPHHYRAASSAHALGGGPDVKRQAIFALGIERGSIALAARLDRSVAKVFSLAHQSAIMLGLSDLPSASTRGLDGIGDALEGEQRAIALADKDAIGGLDSERIGVITLDDLVLAIEGSHFPLQCRGLFGMWFLLGSTRNQQHSNNR